MRRLAYIVPVVYLVVIFTGFQAISIGSSRIGSDGPAPVVPMYVWILTLPWSALGTGHEGTRLFLPMVLGSIVNAGILYFAFGGRWGK